MIQGCPTLSWPLNMHAHSQNILEIHTFTLSLLKVGQPSITNWAGCAHEVINESSDHNGTIEIHWLAYTFPWQQLESTRGCVSLMWPAALCSGLVALSCGWAELRNPPTLITPQAERKKNYSNLMNK